MTLTTKTYNTLNNKRLSNALLHKCVNPFVHLLIIIMKNAYLMRRDVAWVGFWVQDNNFSDTLSFTLTL